MNNNVKSATTAGLLGIFLGGVGAHNWYLGDKQKGKMHVIIFGVGLVLSVLAGGILPAVMSWRVLLSMGWLITLLSGAGWLAMAGSEVWGFVEGIQILTAGDAGLARMGYTVAQPYHQNAGSQNGAMNQPNSQPYGQVNNSNNGINNEMGQNRG